MLAIPFAAWELGMCLLSMGAPDAAILRFSVIGWAMMIIDAAAIMAWPNVELFILQGTLMDDFGLIRQTGLALDFFYSKPGLGMSGLASAVLATVVLLIQGAVLWFIGGAIFKGKEIE